MAGSNDQFEVPGMEESRTASKKPATIDKTSMEKLEKALLPYEKKLQRHAERKASLDKARPQVLLWGLIACIELRTRAPMINIIPTASRKVGVSPS